MRFKRSALLFGTFNLNPAYAELMYFPVIRGNNESKQTVIH